MRDDVTMAGPMTERPLNYIRESRFVGNLLYQPYVTWLLAAPLAGSVEQMGHSSHITQMKYSEIERHT